MKSKLTCPTFATVKTTLSVKDTYEPTAPVDVVRTKEYHPYALGWSGDRGRENIPVEESPQFTEHSAEESSGCSNLPDQDHRNR